MITAERYHDISCGHRVVGHENKCRFLHGHNYRITFILSSLELDMVGRVLDFGVIKSLLCEWLETEWDHKMLIWEHDPMRTDLMKISPESVRLVPFNPTAENMAKYLCEEIAPDQLAGTGTVLVKCTVSETRKCSASYDIKSK